MLNFLWRRRFPQTHRALESPDEFAASLVPLTSAPPAERVMIAAALYELYVATSDFRSGSTSRRTRNTIRLAKQLEDVVESAAGHLDGKYLLWRFLAAATALSALSPRIQRRGLDHQAEFWISLCEVVVADSCLRQNAFWPDFVKEGLLDAKSETAGASGCRLGILTSAPPTLRASQALTKYAERFDILIGGFDSGYERLERVASQIERDQSRTT
jgi:hypothetical protein